MLALAAATIATPARGTTITFPVGTPIATDYVGFLSQTVERDGFTFRRLYGGLWINTFSSGGLHPGGLGVGVLYEGATLPLGMGGVGSLPFSLEAVTILETDSPSGLMLTVVGHQPGAATSFEVELPFDLDTTTYDSFDLLAADARFALVDSATFEVKTEIISPGEEAYIVDAVVATIDTASTPTPTTTPTAIATETATPNATATPADPVCAATPESCRTPVVSGKALLFLKDATGDETDQLAWTWLKGAATSLADFGDPTASDGYALCLYDGTGLVGTASVPAGGSCDGKPCWTARPTSFSYANRSLVPDGLQKILLKPGLVDGQAKIVVRGRGARLAMPSLATLASPITVQLKNPTHCWSATYAFPPAIKHDAVIFKDRAE